MGSGELLTGVVAPKNEISSYRESAKEKQERRSSEGCKAARSEQENVNAERRDRFLSFAYFLFVVFMVSASRQMIQRKVVCGVHKPSTSCRTVSVTNRE